MVSYIYCSQAIWTLFLAELIKVLRWNRSIYQKQLSRGVLRKRCSKHMQQSHWRTPMLKCDFTKVARNFIEIALWHGCSSLNLLHIFRAPFSKNTFERLLLIYPNENYPQCKTVLCNSLEILRQILNFSTNLVLKANY